MTITSARTASVHARSLILRWSRPRPSSTRHTWLSARPAALNAPEAELSDSARPTISAVMAVPRADCADSRADVTASTVSAGAPASFR